MRRWRFQYAVRNASLARALVVNVEPLTLLAAQQLARGQDTIAACRRGSAGQ